MVCVGVATDGREALDVTIEQSPDVLVAAAAMPHLGGVAVALQLRQIAPGIRAVLYDSKQVLPVFAAIARLAECVVARPSIAEIVTTIRTAASASPLRVPRSGDLGG
jgi:CheY-like chemotaxis protein